MLSFGNWGFPHVLRVFSITLISNSSLHEEFWQHSTAGLPGLGDVAMKNFTYSKCLINMCGVNFTEDRHSPVLRWLGPLGRGISYQRLQNREPWRDLCPREEFAPETRQKPCRKKWFLWETVLGREDSTRTNAHMHTLASLRHCTEGLK